MFFRMTLLDSVAFEAQRRKVSRSLFLRQLGVNEVRFNALVSCRCSPTDAEVRALTQAIPLTEVELFRQGPTKSQEQQGFGANEKAVLPFQRGKTFHRGRITA